MEIPQGNSLHSYHRRTKMSSFSFFFFTKSENRRVAGGVDTSGKGEEVGKVCRRVNMCKYGVYMYVNRKMRPTETIPGIRGKKIKENGGGSEFKYDIFDTL
jgi:hypothetical protein